MKMATHRTQITYLVIDHEDNARQYQFDTKESAIKWGKELVEEFETDPENVAVIEREYDEFGNWISQRYIQNNTAHLGGYEGKGGSYDNP